MNGNNIPSDMFWYCTALKGIILPSSIKTICTEAFRRSGLESVTIPDSVEVIGLFAFLEYKVLKTVSIGKGIKLIEANAFGACTNLTTVDIGIEKLKNDGY